MNISVKTVFSKNRVETFYKFHMMKMDKFRYLHYLFILLIIVGIILCVTVFGKYEHGATAMIILIIAGVVGIFSRPYRIYRAYKKIMKNSPLTEKPFTVTFTDDNVIYEMDGEIQLFKWEDIVTVREITDSLYIYVSEGKAIIVPKFILGREDREKLISFIKTKTHYKKHKFGQVAGD